MEAKHSYVYKVNPKNKNRKVVTDLNIFNKTVLSLEPSCFSVLFSKPRSIGRYQFHTVSLSLSVLIAIPINGKVDTHPLLSAKSPTSIHENVVEE